MAHLCNSRETDSRKMACLCSVVHDIQQEDGSQLKFTLEFES